MASRGLALLLLAALAAAASAELKLQQVDRKITINAQFVRVSEDIKIKNLGTAPVDRVTLCGLNGTSPAFIKAQDDKKVEFKTAPSKPAGAPADVSCFDVVLAAPLAAQGTASLDVSTVYYNKLGLYPAEIEQTGTQLTMLRENSYVWSPYAVSAQTTEVVLPSKRALSHSGAEPVAAENNKVKLGRYELIQPWASAPASIHFENAKGFKHVVRCVREITVSHWGNIYFEETFELHNAGAKHKGAFSRLKYQYGSLGKANSFSAVRLRLPAGAHSLYYKDLIGNISSSNVRKASNFAGLALDLEPRYPLMGGWKVDFFVGYSLPLGNGVLARSSKSGKYRLSLPMSAAMEEVSIDELVVRVVLPEGAASIKAELPFGGVEQGRDKVFSYLDTVGRPVLVLTKRGMVPEHMGAEMVVEYSFSSSALWRKGLLLVAAFATLFALLIATNRMEFTISKDARWQEAQQKEVVAGLMQNLSGLLEDQVGAVEELERVAGKMKEASDVDALAASRSEAEAAIKAPDAQIKALLKEVEAASARTGALARDVVDKASGLAAKVSKLVAERAEGAKKGLPAAELNKRLAPAAKAVAEAKAEYAALAGTVMAAY